MVAAPPSAAPPSAERVGRALEGGKDDPEAEAAVNSALAAPGVAQRSPTYPFLPGAEEGLAPG